MWAISQFDPFCQMLPIFHSTTHFLKYIPYFTVWHICPIVTHFHCVTRFHMAILHNVTHFSKFDPRFAGELIFFLNMNQFCTVWHIFLQCYPFFECDPFFQMWPTFYSVRHFYCVTHFSQCDSIFFDICDTFVQLWPILGLAQSDPKR